jgi:hypothetical protein
MNNHSNTGSYSAGFGVTGVAHLGIVEREPDSKESTLVGSVTWALVMLAQVMFQISLRKRCITKGVPTKDGRASSSEGPR